MQIKTSLYKGKVDMVFDTFRHSYTVTDARLEFVEPDDLKNGEPSSPLIIQFNKDDETMVKNLIKVVWDKIQKLDLPQTSKYNKTLQGTKAFERDLLTN